MLTIETASQAIAHAVVACFLEQLHISQGDGDQRCRRCKRLPVIGCERGLAKRGIANPVGGLGDLRRADNLFRPPRRGMGFKFGSL